MACGVRNSPLVRAALLVVFVGCTFGNGPAAPPPVPWRPDLTEGSTYNTRIVALRTTLGRAGITLTARGSQEVVRSSTCEMPEPIRSQVGCVRCELAGESDPIDDAVLDAIKTGFDRYPTAVLVATGMQHVTLCKHIEYENMKRGQDTAGTADVYGHRMLLSIEAFFHRVYDEAGTFTAEDIVHHELFHLFEFHRMRTEFTDDPEWRLYNPLGFEYGVHQERPAGFVNPYAATNDVEDRASVFQYLMTRPNELCELAKTDKIVRAKVKLLWSRMSALVDDNFLRDRATCVDWIGHEKNT